MKFLRILLVLAFLVGVQEVRAAFLGVELEPGYFAGQSALTVRSVAPRSPAAAAGFLPGDVISRVAHQPVTQPEDLVSVVRGARPGTRMEIEVLRAGQRVPLTVTLADSGPTLVPPDAGGSVPSNETLGAKLGLPASGVAFTIKESPHCSVLAPPGWNFHSNANASTAEREELRGKGRALSIPRQRFSPVAEVRLSPDGLQSTPSRHSHRSIAVVQPRESGQSTSWGSGRCGGGTFAA
jgi:membrane-associated protease RseP (regulator of RpoE activity)